jgi:hypothetical protein
MQAQHCRRAIDVLKCSTHERLPGPAQCANAKDNKALPAAHLPQPMCPHMRQIQRLLWLLHAAHRDVPPDDCMQYLQGGATHQVTAAGPS